MVSGFSSPATLNYDILLYAVGSYITVQVGSTGFGSMSASSQSIGTVALGPISFPTENTFVRITNKDVTNAITFNKLEMIGG